MNFYFNEREIAMRVKLFFGRAAAAACIILE